MTSHSNFNSRKWFTGNHIHYFVILIILFSLSITTTYAADRWHYTFSPESKLWFDGTSTLHDFTCNANVLNGMLEMDSSTAGGKMPGTSGSGISLQVQIPVKDIDSGHGKMNDNMYSALKAKTQPEISFVMQGLDSLVSVNADSNIYSFVCQGALTVAGTTNNVRMLTKARLLPDGRIHASGKQAILMTDYNIKPPAFMLGTLKTGNEILLHYDVYLQRETNVMLGDNYNTPLQSR